MDSIETQESWLKTPDNHSLYTKTWRPSAALKARVVFLHGFSDHCNWYPILFSTFAQKGIKVYSFDQRGWGRSVHEVSQRGSTGPNSQVMTDITTFINSLPQDEKDVPLFLMGHSMGGGEVLYYASTGPQEVVSKIRGLLLEAPLIAMPAAAAPWKITVALGRLAAKMFPTRPLVRKLDPSAISRDPEVCQQWVEDSLNHDTGTLEALAATLARSADLDEGRVVLKEGSGEGGKTRVWIGQGTNDLLCSYDAARRWYDRIQVDDKEFRVYEGWKHKLHSEPGEDKYQFANDAATWILDRCGPVSEFTGSGPKSKL